MIRVVSSLALLSIIVLSSALVPAFSFVDDERSLGFVGAANNNYSQLQAAQHTTSGQEGPDMVKFHDRYIDANSIVSDFGFLKFEGHQLQYNGNPSRTLFFGPESAQAFSKNTYIYGLGGSNGSGNMLGVAVSFAGSTTLPALPSSASADDATYMPDLPLAFDSNDYYVAKGGDGRLSGSSIIGSDVVEGKYNITGRGVKVALVDTGADFSNPDMQHALARDKNGVPIMLDADGQGIVLTRTKFVANIDNKTGRISDYPDKTKVPKEFESYVFVNGTGAYIKTQGSNIPVYNTLYPLFGTPLLNATASVDWKIGNGPDDYIHSKSGVYRFGVMYQAQMSLGTTTFSLVPFLVVDGKQAGVYDTIIPDMSAAWYFFAHDEVPRLIQADLKSDQSFDFTDESPIKLGDGKEFLTYDYDKDGFPDFSAGAVGARVLDVWRVIDKYSNVRVGDEGGYGGAVQANLLKPMDPDGEYFGVMYDFQGHGTGTAATIASAGINDYSVYGNGTMHKLRGIAPGAQIIPVKSLWIGDALYGWLYAAGFETGILDGRWYYGYGQDHRADIISNSWGIPSFPLMQSGQGYDVLSMFSSLLTIPGGLAEGYPGVIMINSVGNEGLGYGSVGSPNVSPLGISVGATTNNVYIGFDGFRNLTRFGNSTQAFDDVADFSSRGPGLLGDPKPEVMGIGSYAFTPSGVNAKILQSSENDSRPDTAFMLFGGTSMAAPMTAGAAALVIEQEHRLSGKSDGVPIDPFEVKSILMSSAKDLGNDPFTQGSGRVDAERAVRLARGADGTFSIYTNDTVKNILQALKPAVLASNDTMGIISTGVHGQSVADRLFGKSGQEQESSSTDYLGESRWFGGFIEQGGNATTQIVVENPSDQEIRVRLAPSIEKLVSKYEVKNSTRLFETDPLHNSTEFGYTPNYINIEKAIGGPIPKDADLMVAKVNFAFSDFMNLTEFYADGLKIASIYAYDWQDANHDNITSFNETTMINRGGSWGTMQETRISDPVHRFGHTPLIGVYPVPGVFSYWTGDRQINATSMNYTLTIEFYERKQNPAIAFENGDPIDGHVILDIGPNGSGKVGATIKTEKDAISGVYYGTIVAQSIENNGKTGDSTVVPVSYVVTSKPVPKDVPVVFTPVAGDGDNTLGQKATSAAISAGKENLGLRPNGYIGGTFDMTSRYPTGDWRSYYFSVQDKTITSLSLKVSWLHNDTSINAMVFAPDGKLVASSVPAGVFQKLSGWASNDWLGSSSFSEGGGFIFSQNDGDSSSVLFVPINQTGIYSVLLHNTLFYGESLYEPVSVEAKFSTILPDSAPPAIVADVPPHINALTRVPIRINEENLADYKYSVDLGPMVTPSMTTWALQEPQTFDIVLDGAKLEEGVHRLSIVSTDSVGHTSNDIFTFDVDRTAPSIDLRPGTGNTTTTTDEDENISDIAVSKADSISWSVTDGNDGGSSIKLPIKISLPNGTAIESGSASSKLTFESLKDGQYTFSITAKDAAGNVATKERRLVVDSTAPSASFAISGDQNSEKGKVQMSIDVEDPNLKNASLVIDGQRNINVTGIKEYQIDTTGIQDGKHEIKLLATDTAGNTKEVSKTITTVNTKSQMDLAQLTGVGIGLMAGLGVAFALWIFAGKKKHLA